MWSFSGSSPFSSNPSALGFLLVFTSAKSLSANDRTPLPSIHPFTLLFLFGTEVFPLRSQRLQALLPGRLGRRVFSPHGRQVPFPPTCSSVSLDRAIFPGGRGLRPERHPPAKKVVFFSWFLRPYAFGLQNNFPFSASWRIPWTGKYKALPLLC